MYELKADRIIRVSDGAIIPEDPGNGDYLQFLAWQQAGNTPVVAVVSLEDAKQAKIEDLSQICQTTIVSGFVSLALGAPHRYSSEREDQINLLGAKAAGTDMMYVCIDENGDKRSRWHTAEQIGQVFFDGVVVKATCIQQFHELRLQVEAAATLEEIEQIQWEDLI